MYFFYKSRKIVVYFSAYIYYTFLYKSVLYHQAWISILFHVSYLWILEFFSSDWQYFIIKQVTSNTYDAANVRILNYLNNCLQEVLELTPNTDLITLFVF
jgi:hypothetical protein